MLPRPKRCKFEIFKIWHGKYWLFYWRFMSGNGQEVAMSSHGYTRKENCKHAINLINLYGQSYWYRADIEDLTK